MKLVTFLKGAAIGAGCMYLFDPSRGRTRRARIRDNAVHVWNEAGDAVESNSRHLANRARGMLHEAKTCISSSARGGLVSTSQSWMPVKWSPTTKLLVTAGAGLLALYGKRRGDMLGAALGALSVGVITNSVSMRELRHGVEIAPSMPSDYAEEEDQANLFAGVNANEHQRRASRSY